MWRKKLGNTIAAIFTAMFVLLAATMVFTFVFGGVFLFTQAAWAADSSKSNDYCFSCHSNEGMSINYQGKEVSLTINKETFENSVHGSLKCIACHSGTDSFPHQTKYNSDFRQQMLESCSTCHGDIYQQYKNSIHGHLGNLVSCSSCHGSYHEILPADNSEAQHHRFNINQSCSTCHTGMVVESYERSFHGIAYKYGYDKAPSCVDCHSSHNILPSDNPASPIAAANIGSTCEPCHTGMINAGANLLNGKNHTVPEDKENAFPLWVTWKIFLGLILFDVVMNGTIPTFELFRHLRNMRNKTTKISSGAQKNI